jgi:N-acetylmuramoyl-L-alanine amidase
MALLLEVGFLTDPHELAAMQSEEWQSEMTNAIAEALDRYFIKKESRS